MSSYPEHDKLHAVADKSQAIGEFLEANEYTLYRWNHSLDRMEPVPGWINDLLAAHFGIDRDKLEAEKREMLAVIRESYT